MKVLFLNLPYKFEISRSSRWPEKTKSGTLYYPYYLSYAAGVCQSKNIEVNLVDCITEKYNLKDTLREISNIGPNYIVCETTTPTASDDYQTINEIKENFPDIKIIVGGTHATVLPQEVLSKCNGIIVVRKEYDYIIPEILYHDDISKVKGVSYKNDNGKIVHNEDAPVIEDLDKLPYVSKVYEQFLNCDDYSYAFAQKPMIQILSARGCPNQCNFCSYPSTMGNRLFRARTASNFVDEIEYIYNNMKKIKEIFIEDDTFTVDKKRVEDICDEIIRRGLKPIWSCNTRVDLPFKTMRKMKKAGCRLLVVGYESGSQRVLNETKKGITLEQSLEFAKNTKKLKIKVFGCFMIGLKGDNLDAINETYEFAKKVYPDMCFFQQVVPFPGTEFYTLVKENSYLITEDYSKWLNKDGYLDCLVDYPYANHEEIEKIRDNLMSKYYFSFTYIFKTFLANLDYNELKRVFRGGFNYISFRFKKRFM
ncbi:MAG: B12-binding domain-containing radical SAM protein [Methanobrevibacter sp.]|jgi:radical SAM superfamily enzyme YgiQ (UPF0313 family)|nr:B12-binding domain-containing radical SAM protein [Candidatus Methanovirga basalitermitum]